MTFRIPVEFHLKLVFRGLEWSFDFNDWLLCFFDHSVPRTLRNEIIPGIIRQLQKQVLEYEALKKGIGLPFVCSLPWKCLILIEPCCR